MKKGIIFSIVKGKIYSIYRQFYDMELEKCSREIAITTNAVF
jgi:hypothetical protein